MSIIDFSPKPKTVTLNNGASISSLRSRFGGSSLYLNGGGYASVANNTDFGLGTGDFTIEAWVYPFDNNNWRTLFEIGTFQNGLMWRMGTNAENLYINNTSYNWNPSSVPLNTWSHLALVRNSGTIRVFINGTQSFSVSNGGDLGTEKPLYIGGRSNGSETFAGFMDEVRITKGIGTAKYTSNFDIKTLYAPFPSSGTPVTPPNAPTELVAGPLNQRINMVWTAPAEDNGGIITDYSIQYSTDGNNWNDFAHSPSVVPAISVTGLNNGTTYSVRVGAVNYTGIGSYISESNLVPAVPAVDSNPDPYFYNTSLLLHFDEGHNSTNVVDTSYLPKTASVQADAKISIAKQKFGGSSMYFNGNAYINVPNHPGLDFGNEDFTIEYWEYRTGSSAHPVMTRTRTSQGYNPWLIGTNESGTLKVYFGAGDTDYNNWDVVSSLSMGSTILNAWTHYAVVRQGNTIRTYQNGSQITTATTSAYIGSGSGPLSIGRYADNSDTSNYYIGYLDDIRITRGICRYPDGAAFTPPTLPFSDIAPSISLPEAPPSISAFGGDALAEVNFASPASDKSIPVSYDLQYSEDLPEPAWTSVTSSPTRLLLHFNKNDIRGNAKIKDYSLYNRNILWNTTNNPAFIGGASSAGTYQKFGNGCLDIPYNRTGYTTPYVIKVDESSDLNPGTGDYTLEMFFISDWAYYSGKYSNGVGRLFGCYNGTSGSYWGLWGATGWNSNQPRIAKFVNGSQVYYKDFTGGELNANTDNWGVGNYNTATKHLVFCRQNGTMRIYLNGAKVHEVADTNDDNFAAGGLVIMGGESSSHNANNYVLGRLDELRYTIGEALYTGSSIDLLPTAEFKNTKVANLPNNKNYIFRLRSQNSAGYGNFITSSAVNVAPPPEISITSEPQNNRVLSSSENATFSVTATISDNSSLSYQWQKYVIDAEYSSNKAWVNIDGATSSSVTINSSIFSPYCCAQPKMDPVRCIISSAYGVKLTKQARLVSIQNLLSNFYVYPDSNYNNNYGQVNGVWYDGYYVNNVSDRLNLYIDNMGGWWGGGVTDASWYTGNDTSIKFQYSVDATNWTDVDSQYNINFQSTVSSTYQNKQTPLMSNVSGRVYFKAIIEDLWPYNTNNGTTSATESLYSIVNRYFWIDFPT